MPPSDEFGAGYATAVTAESLYLANLLITPGLGFLLLLVSVVAEQGQGAAVGRGAPVADRVGQPVGRRAAGDHQRS